MDDKEREIAGKIDVVNKTEDRPSNWKSLAAYIYLIICIMDFIIMPVVVQVDYSNTKAEIKKLIISEDNKDFVIQVLDRVKVEQWQPVSLAGGGLLHLAFGALLTGAAVTRGLERREALKSN